MDQIRVALKEALLELEKGTKEIRSSAIIRRDGIMIESTLPLTLSSGGPRLDLKRGAATVARLGAMVANTADVISGEMGRGELQQLVIDTGGSKIVAMGAGPDAILLCHLKEASPIVLLNMSTAASRIKEILA